MGAYNAGLQREGEDDLAAAFSRWVRSPHNTAHNRMAKMLTILDESVRLPLPCGSFHCETWNASSNFWARRYPTAEGVRAVRAHINGDAALLKRCLRGLETRYVSVSFFDRLADSLSLLAREIAAWFGHHTLLQQEAGSSVPSATSLLELQRSTAEHASERPSKEVSPYDREEIRLRNALDIKVYEWGVRQLEHALRKRESAS